MSIAILCPSKGRPQQFKRMIESADRMAEVKPNIYAAISKEEGDSYNEAIELLGKVFLMPDGLPTVHKWNVLAEEAMKNPANKLFMLAADDVIFSTPLWDRALLEAYNKLGNKIHVFSLLDSRDPEGTPHPIVTREYIEAMGYFVPPIFLHWFVDSWTVQMARSAGVFTHLKEYLLIHDKPSDRGKPDSTHTGIRSMGWHDRDKWVAQNMDALLGRECYRLLTHVVGHTSAGPQGKPLENGMIGF